MRISGCARELELAFIAPPRSPCLVSLTQPTVVVKSLATLYRQLCCYLVPLSLYRPFCCAVSPSVSLPAPPRPRSTLLTPDSDPPRLSDPLSLDGSIRRASEPDEGGMHLFAGFANPFAMSAAPSSSTSTVASTSTSSSLSPAPSSASSQSSFASCDSHLQPPFTSVSPDREQECGDDDDDVEGDGEFEPRPPRLNPPASRQ